MSKQRLMSKQRCEHCVGTIILPGPICRTRKAAIETYAAKSSVVLKPAYDAENLSSVLSLVTSTGGVTLQPLYVNLMLPSSVVIRPLQGDVPIIELILSYSRSNTSALLKRFLARTDQLIASVAKPETLSPAKTGACGVDQLPSASQISNDALFAVEA
jgi:DNA-binding transcriptional LysR family regulator